MAQDEFAQTEEYLERSFQNMEMSFSYIFKIMKKLFNLIATPLEKAFNALVPKEKGDVEGDELF